MRFGQIPSRDKYPCNDFPDGICPDRKRASQDTCPKMLAAKAKAAARKELEQTNKMKTEDAIDFQVKQSARVSKRKPRRV